MSGKSEVTYTLEQIEQWQVFTGEPESGGDVVVGLAFEIEGVIVNLVMTPLMMGLMVKSMTDAMTDARRAKTRGAVR
jgi:hypothetical protein